MKGNRKDSSEKPIWDRSSSGLSMTRPAGKLMIWLILFISVTYIIYTLKIVSTSRPCEDLTSEAILQQRPEKKAVVAAAEAVASEHEATDLNHVVFGIAASSKLWKQRKEYIKIWYKPKKMRGYVWLDKEIKTKPDDGDQENLPAIRISGDTSSFPYTNKQGHRSAIRISRIISETLRHLDSDSEKNVRWFVMGDDDTVFVTDNLIRVLRKYDHEQMYYIGSLSESHLQNIFFSYGMAYGGGGFAISYPLAVALSKIQDRCIQRYPALYGSDDRMQACMAELGVPLTKEQGFHQYDVHGNLFGLLAAHPVTPFVSMHHLDVVEPIFPNMTRVRAIKKLTTPMKLDSAALLQQSICYDKYKRWTVSVSWGYAVQVFRGSFSPREMEMPSRTFLNWYKKRTTPPTHSIQGQ